MQQNYSGAFLRRRRFLMVLPVLVVPFTTLLFSAMGGGEETSAAAAKGPEGLNMELPSPMLKNDSGWNKMSFYRKADEDSARLRNLIKKDPYYVLPAVEDTSLDFSGERTSSPLKQEKKVYEKLAELHEQLKPPSYSSRNNTRVSRNSHDEISADVQQLGRMMHEMQEPGGPDPEMEQLKGMLETLRDIQHPELVNQKIRERSASEKGKMFPLMAGSAEAPVTLLWPPYAIDTSQEYINATGFYGLENIAVQTAAPVAASVPAIVAKRQTLVNGSVVKLQLLEDIFVNGFKVPAGHFVYGVAQLSGERLNITISSLRVNKSIFPVSLSVFDLDGLEGIFIPGAITRDVAKQSVDQPLQNLGMLSLDASLGAQAATAGVETAKKIISRKVRQVKVTVEAGYEVLLCDSKNY